MNLKRLKRVGQAIGYVGLLLLAVQGVLSVLGGPSFLDAGPRPPLAVLAAAPDVGRESAPALAAGDPTVPQLLHYQGYLRDGTGQPLDGTYDMVIRIYDTPSVAETLPSSIKHQETHTGVQVRHGSFSLLLGDQPGNAFSADLFGNPDLYFGVTVGANPEMAPRQRLASVAYAIHAQHSTEADHAVEASHANNADMATNADKLDGLHASSFARPGDLNNFTFSIMANSSAGGSTQPAATKITGATSSNAFCTLARVRVYGVDGTKEGVECNVFLNGGQWYVRATTHYEGSYENASIQCTARCMSW